LFPSFVISFATLLCVFAPPRGLDSMT